MNESFDLENKETRQRVIDEMAELGYSAYFNSDGIGWIDRLEDGERITRDCDHIVWERCLGILHENHVIMGTSFV